MADSQLPWGESPNLSAPWRPSLCSYRCYQLFCLDVSPWTSQWPRQIPPKSCWCDTGGMLAVVPEGSSPINDLAISFKTRWWHFRSSPRSLQDWSLLPSSILASGNPGRKLGWSHPVHCSTVLPSGGIELFSCWSCDYGDIALGCPSLRGHAPQRPLGGMGVSQSSWVSHSF